MQVKARVSGGLKKHRLLGLQVWTETRKGGRQLRPSRCVDYPRLRYERSWRRNRPNWLAWCLISGTGNSLVPEMLAPRYLAREQGCRQADPYAQRANRVSDFDDHRTASRAPYS